MGRHRLVALLALVSLTACRPSGDGPPDAVIGSDTGAQPPDAPGLDAFLEPDAGPPIPSSALIVASEGGEIATADGAFGLYVPPGALAEDTTISVSEIATADWPSEASAPLAGVYDVSPDGLTFLSPAFAIHRLPGRAPALLTPEGDPRFAFHHARSADGTVEVVPTHTIVFAERSVVVGEITHLSAHWASTEIRGGPTLTARVVADAGRHALDTEWLASHVSVQTAGSLGPVELRVSSSVGTEGSSYVVPVSHAGWSGSTEHADGFFSRLSGLETRYSYRSSPPTTVATIDAATPFAFPAPLPGWRCVAPADPGTSLIWISVVAGLTPPGASFPFFFELRTDIGTPSCITREEKPEWVAQSMSLGPSRMAPIAVPATATRNLAETMGKFGHVADVPPGATIRVCVTASMPTSVLYQPRFHPGYDFRDVSPPGCTEITNLDPVNPNEVLIIVEGAGSPNDVTVTTTLLPGP